MRGIYLAAWLVAGVSGFQVGIADGLRWQVSSGTWAAKVGPEFQKRTLNNSID